MLEQLGGANTEKAVNAIIEYIIENGLSPSDKLPSEREFADLIGVGRPAIREALKIASAFGIVTIKQYDGLYVAEQESRVLSLPFKIRMNMGQFDLSQLFEVRRVFEVEVMKLAALRITDDQIAALETILDQEDIENASQFAECDMKFHSTIYQSTGNALLVMLMKIVNELSSLSRRITGRVEDTRHIVHRDHLEILNALKKRDASLCGKSMLNHIDHLQKITEIDTTLYEHMFQKQLREIANNEISVDES